MTQMTGQITAHQAFDDYKADYFVMQHGDRIGYITIAGGGQFIACIYEGIREMAFRGDHAAHEYVITDDLVQALVAFRA